MGLYHRVSILPGRRPSAAPLRRDGVGPRPVDLGDGEEQQRVPHQAVRQRQRQGLANKKTVLIRPAAGKVVLATTKTKKQNKPGSLYHRSVMKKEFSKMAKAVKNQVTDNYYRPDLTKAALARLSVVHRSLKVAKSGPKKKLRQG